MSARRTLKSEPLRKANLCMNSPILSRRHFLGASAASVFAVSARGDEEHSDAAAHREAHSRHGMVACSSLPACEVGQAILRDGGNAVDAAVGVGFAMAVTHPAAGNIGGGGFMLVYPPGKKPVCIDYRETAPAAAKVDMFATDNDRHTHKQVGVPGTVLGLATAHKRFGKLKWNELILPAVKLASDGFALDPSLAKSLNVLLGESADFEELQRVFGKTGPWQAGDNLVQPDLAESLDRIASHGPKAFYAGPIAEMIVAEMKAGDGLITADDLKAYTAKVRQPIHAAYHGHDVYGPPPPSSGGITLGLMLNMLAMFPLKKQGRFSPATLHQMLETMKRAYRDRAAHLGDADFVDIPAQLTTKAYAHKLARQIDEDRATPSKNLAGEIKLSAEGDSTTHYSVIDEDGLAVSNTYTLEQSYGSRIVVRGAGFLLNNEMGDFNPRPGVTDGVGRIGTAANRIAPGKRMLSSQCPTIVARDDKPVLITGSPGGRTIINTVLCNVLNVLAFEMPLRDAVAAPRLHHSWLPDVALYERGGEEPAEKTLAKLSEMGHMMREATFLGNAHSVQVTDDGYHGVADGRRFEAAALGV